MTCFFIIVAKCVNVKCNAHEMCHDGICRCKKGYTKSMAAKGKCVKGEVPFTKLGPDNGKNLWMPKTNQSVNKTDWFFLAGILDARARRRLEWKLKQNFFIVFFFIFHFKWRKARLAIRRRADLFAVNILANKISLPHGQQSFSFR